MDILIDLTHSSSLLFPVQSMLCMHVTLYLISFHRAEDWDRRNAASSRNGEI